MRYTKQGFGRAKAAIATFALAVLAFPLQAEIDGHGPDAWRVTGVSSNDTLSARMGPGTSYPVIESFAHNERGMQQITCVPFYTAAHYTAMTEAQIKALPPRWCLMRSKDLTKAGWVAQRYITPDGAVAPALHEEDAEPASAGNAMIADAIELVRELYERQALADAGGGPDPWGPAMANDYFTEELASFLSSGQVQAHPLYGAQDFDGKVDEPQADPDEPMLRGMITINVDFTNFGRKQRAVFYLRADTNKPEAPLRIFRVEHEGWSYP